MTHKARLTAQIIVVLLAFAVGIICFFIALAIGNIGLFPIEWSDWVNTREGWSVLLIFILAIGVPVVLPIWILLAAIGSLTKHDLMYPPSPLSNLLLIALCAISGLLLGWQTT